MSIRPSPIGASRRAALPCPSGVRPRAARWLFSLLLLLCAAAPIACGHRGPQPGASDALPTEPITIEIQNRHTTDMVIYVLRGNTRARLGSVSPAATKTFTLPLVYSGDIGGFYLIGDPVGERQGITSERVIAQGGQRVVWSLEARLNQSSLGIY